MVMLRPDTMVLMIEAIDLSLPVRGLGQPVVTVCAWCESNGRMHGSARECSSMHWQSVSHEFVRAHTAAGTASHGLCDSCKSAMLQATNRMPAPSFAAAG